MTFTGSGLDEVCFRDGVTHAAKKVLRLIDMDITPTYCGPVFGTEPPRISD